MREQLLSRSVSRKFDKLPRYNASKQHCPLFTCGRTRSGAALRSLQRQKLRVRGGGGGSLAIRSDSIKDGWSNRRPYSRSVSELTPPKMKCTLGDPRTDPKPPYTPFLSPHASPFTISRDSTLPTESIFTREARAPRRNAPPSLGYTRFGIQIPSYVTRKMFIGSTKGY